MSKDIKITLLDLKFADFAEELDFTYWTYLYYNCASCLPAALAYLKQLSILYSHVSSLSLQNKYSYYNCGVKTVIGGIQTLPDTVADYAMQVGLSAV